MANYKERTEGIISNIKSKDLVAPGNPFLKDFYSSFVYIYRTMWENFISSPDNKITSNVHPDKTIVNPSKPEDPTDIGVINLNTDVFIPINNNDKDKLFYMHCIRQIRNFCSDVLLNYRLETTEIKQGNLGRTSKSFKKDIRDDSREESRQELGDNSDDPEV